MPALTAMPAYYWVITEDHIHQPEEDTAIGVAGGEDDHRGDDRARFELYDVDSLDNERLCFVGYIYGEYDGTEPLTDFGKDYGCIKVKLAGEWI